MEDSSTVDVNVITTAVDSSGSQVISITQSNVVDSSTVDSNVTTGGIGLKGDTGASSTVPGPTGPAGADSTVPGPAGPSNSLSIGTVTSGTAGATITGASPNQILNLVLQAGATGATGKGISTIAKTGTVGLVDTYTITYTDATTATFTVTNGSTGATGKGISTIAKTSTVGLVDTYTITYSDASTSTFTVTNGAVGATGTAATVAVGTTTTGTAAVTNSGSSSAAVFNFTVPQGVAGTPGAVWYEAAGAPSTTHNNGDFYLNGTNGDVYEQTAGAWGSPIANIKGAAGAGSGDMLASVYDPTAKHANAFSQDNMADGTTNKNYSATDKTKLAGIATGAQVNAVTTVAGRTGAVVIAEADISGLTADLVAKEVLTNKATDFTTINNTLYPTVQAVNNAITTATVGLLDYRGSYDASGNTYPSSGGSGPLGVINKGDFWICSVVGTLNSTPVSPGDLIIALVDLPGSTNANWDLVAHDSDLSIYALKTTTVNGYALSSNVTVTASDVGALPISGGTLTGDLTLSTHNLITDITTGTKIGTATNQKIGHYGSTPVVQPSATTELGTVLSSSGLRATGTAYPITTSGAVSLSGYVSAPNINQGLTSTVTAAGTTTLVYTSPQTQILTGTNTQILKLPTTSVAVGWDVVVINQSTGLVTVTASGGTTVQILAPSTHAIITALAATPTTNTQWDSRYIGSNNASGKSLTTNNTLTLAGTDGTTMTMPASSDTLVGNVTTATLTYKDLSSATNTFPLGSVVQFVATSTSSVATGTATIPLDNTIPQITEGTEFITVTITPKSLTNRLLIEHKGLYSGSVNTDMIVALFQDSTANALAVSWETTGGSTYGCTMSLIYEMAAGTTSATTFRVRAGGGATSTVTLNGQVGSSLFGSAIKTTLTITEIKA